MRISDWSSDVCSSDLDLRGFDGYRSARSETASGAIWLNANEAAYATVADDAGGLRRYPSPQPDALRSALAALYDCPPHRLLIGRGSAGAIAPLVRRRKRVGEGKSVSGTDDFGGARIHK